MTEIKPGDYVDVRGVAVAVDGGAMTAADVLMQSYPSKVCALR
ncbi:hypothetical protein [Bradyrhizobium sp. SZCCHNS1054]|nr:hypothetical protein [Bradyrhizobium sp. SZCCHNS1054]